MLYPKYSLLIFYLKYILWCYIRIYDHFLILETADIILRQNSILLIFFAFLIHENRYRCLRIILYFIRDDPTLKMDEGVLLADLASFWLSYKLCTCLNFFSILNK